MKKMMFVFCLGIFLFIPEYSNSTIIPFAFWQKIRNFDSTWTPKWSNLKAYWKFNGTVGAISSGATLTDYFGTSNGTSSGTGLSYATGLVDQGVLFNSSRHFSVPQASPSNICSNITFMTWVKYDALTSTSWSSLVTSRNACNSTAGWSISQNNNEKRIELALYTSGGVSTVVSTATPLDGNWHHIAFTLTSGGAAILYIDGVQEATQSISIGAGICSPSVPMLIGGAACSSPMGAGLLDEMAVWNTVLTATEIQGIYNQQR